MTLLCLWSNYNSLERINQCNPSVKKHWHSDEKMGGSIWSYAYVVVKLTMFGCNYTCQISIFTMKKWMDACAFANLTQYPPTKTLLWNKRSPLKKLDWNCCPETKIKTYFRYLVRALFFKVGWRWSEFGYGGHSFFLKNAPKTVSHNFFWNNCSPLDVMDACN